MLTVEFKPFSYSAETKYQSYRLNHVVDVGKNLQENPFIVPQYWGCVLGELVFI